MPREKVYIVDDEKSMRDFLEIMLSREGYEVRTFQHAADILACFRERPADLVVTDVKMPGMDGVELLKELKDISPDTEVVMMTAYASVDTAIEAIRAGAYDYLTKPFKVDDIKIHIRKAIERRMLKRENLLLKKDLKRRCGERIFVVESPQMKEVSSLIKSAAATRTTVFITGESGTGKELVARAVHNESPRRDMPFVAVNCAAIPEDLLESELFGHVKGAFTGAFSGKEGLVEMSDGGTLFLDEITEMPQKLQVKLLRFIQEKSFRRVGGAADSPVDVRLIAASNKDVEALVQRGEFREDLFYRLNVIRVAVAPLRKRREDIAPLARHFLDRYSREFGKPLSGISIEAMGLLLGYDYPGNVRELENVIERAVALEAGSEIGPASLPAHVSTAAPRGEAGVARTGRVDVDRLMEGIEVPPEGLDLEGIVSRIERALLKDALDKADGVKKKAAELLGLSFRSMRYKISKYENPKD